VIDPTLALRTMRIVSSPLVPLTCFIFHEVVAFCCERRRGAADVPWMPEPVD